MLRGSQKSQTLRLQLLMALFIIKQTHFTCHRAGAFVFYTSDAHQYPCCWSQLSQYRVVGDTSTARVLQLKHVGGEASSQDGRRYLSPQVISSYLQTPGAFLHGSPWVGRRSWAALLFALQLSLCHRILPSVKISREKFQSTCDTVSP